jgi:hypothetical protein
MPRDIAFEYRRSYEDRTTPITDALKLFGLFAALLTGFVALALIAGYLLDPSSPQTESFQLPAWHCCQLQLPLRTFG